VKIFSLLAALLKPSPSHWPTPKHWAFDTAGCTQKTDKWRVRYGVATCQTCRRIPKNPWLFIFTWPKRNPRRSHFRRDWGRRPDGRWHGGCQFFHALSRVTAIGRPEL